MEYGGCNPFNVILGSVTLNNELKNTHLLWYTVTWSSRLFSSVVCNERAESGALCDVCLLAWYTPRHGESCFHCSSLLDADKWTIICSAALEVN